MGLGNINLGGKSNSKLRGTQTSDKQLHEYLEYCEFKKKMTVATMKTKRQSINKFLRENPNITDFRQITNELFDHWCLEMSKAGKTGKTVNNYADHVLACLRFHQNKRGLQIKLRLEAIDRCEEEEVELPVFTREEIKLIKDNCAGLRELLLISLVFDSALRISEVANMNFANIDGSIITLVGKGRKRRSTFMLYDTRHLLDRWLLLMGVTDGYVFQSPTNFEDHLSVQQIRASINAPIRRAGFSEGSAHAIRRSSITEVLNGGMPLQEAALFAGHSDPKVTLRHYYRPQREKLQNSHAQALSY